ncbi:MAG: lipid A deacylase LpxR family protein [Melioribacteraceae bacterium]|nr:lipid A deacylase LpxR family protein [Melioribacteraceae bacterium]
MTIKTFILFLFVPFLILSQERGDLDKIEEFGSFEFKWSNDFEYQTDYYYTNGFAFEVFAPWAKASHVNSILLPIKSYELELNSLTLTQDIFTPKAKFSIDDQLNGDRPFAAYLLLGFQKVTFSKAERIRTYSEIEVGVLGPAAFGEEVQNGIHNYLPTSALVKGWENQISNSPMLNYSASIEKQFYYNNWLELSGKTSVKLGLPFTNADVGILTRVGLFDSFPKDFEFLSPKKWQLFLTLSASGSLVGYNATLQGGLFYESVYTLSSINRFVGYAAVGITLIYKKFEMEYVQQFNTPEFPGAVYHSWGYLLIKFGF